MSLKESFNRMDAVRQGDCVLRIYNGVVYTYYDFAQRLVFTTSSGHATVPFSQIDRDVLIEARDKLVELGGHPPELPPERAAAPAPPKKFNL